MSSFNRWLLFALLVPIVVTFSHAEMITTYDTRFGIAPVASGHRAVDIAIYAPWMRSVAVPALIDTRLNIGVTITGTVEQAEAQLATLASNTFPAIVREQGKDVKQDARTAAANAAAANSVPALRAEVKRLAELLENALERLEKVEQ